MGTFRFFALVTTCLFYFCQSSTCFTLNDFHLLKQLDNSFANSGIECPHPYGIFRHPRNCHKYIKCTEGQLQEINCPVTGSNEILICTPYDEPCPAQSLFRVRRHAKQTWDCPYEHRMFAIADDCKRYLHCKNRRMLIESCPDNQTFSELLSRCIDGYNPDCETDPFDQAI